MGSPSRASETTEPAVIVERVTFDEALGMRHGEDFSAAAPPPATTNATAPQSMARRYTRTMGCQRTSATTARSLRGTASEERRSALRTSERPDGGVASTALHFGC